MKEEKQKAFVFSSECENGSHEALFYPDKCPPNCHPEFTFPCPLFFVSFEDETRMENSLIILFAMFWPLQSSIVYLIQTVFLNRYVKNFNEMIDSSLQSLPNKIVGFQIYSNSILKGII